MKLTLLTEVPGSSSTSPAVRSSNSAPVLAAGLLSAIVPPLLICRLDASDSEASSTRPPTTA